MSIWTSIPAQAVHSPSIPVLSVGNLKGGVGKTTVVANLAIALVQAGIRVLAIDLDFQASLSVALPPNIIPRREIADGGVHVLLNESYDMFHDERITAVGVRPFEDLSLVRTSFRLADVEDKLFAAFILDERTQDPRFALARKLSDRRLSKHFDLVLIDTPPRLTMGSINALCASTHVLIPTSLTAMSRNGAVTFAECMSEFRKALCPSLSAMGVLATFTAAGSLSAAEAKALDELQRFLPGIEIWRDIFIPVRQDIANNRVQQSPDSRGRFQFLAQKIISKLGLGFHGSDEDRHAHQGARSSWADLPE